MSATVLSPRYQHRAKSEDLWQFCYEAPSEFEDALEYLDLSSDRTAKHRNELSRQT